MGLFRYEAVDRSGKVVRGVMNARDEEQVARNLESMGYAARGIYSQSSARGRAAATAAPPQPAALAGQPATGARMGPRRGIESVTLASGVPVTIRSCVHTSALAAYFRQLATLVKSGMGISQALVEVSMNTRDGRLRRVIPELAEATQSGRRLSGAMAEYPGLFPVHTIAAIWAGELAGNLEIALQEVASDLEQETSETRFGRIGWGIAKIHIIALMVLIPASNVANLLIPALEKALSASQSVGAVQVIGFVVENYVRTMLWKSLAAIGVLLAIWIGLGHAKRIPTVKRFLDGVLIGMPVWGRLQKDRALARFLHVMDGLYAAGIGPGQSWEAASLVVRNSAIAERLRLARSRVSANAGVAELFAASGVFEPDEVGMAASGEKSGQVPEVLANMSSIYTDKAAAASTRGRVVSVTLLNLAIGAMTVFIFYRIVNSYCTLAEKAAEIIGRP